MTRSKSMSVERYADALHDREQILDRCEIAYEGSEIGGRIVGDLGRAWKLLATHARLHQLPFRPESLDLTNRDHGWESRMASDPLLQAKFRRAYAVQLVRGGIRLYSTNGVALDQSTKIDELVRDDARMRNPLLFVSARIPGLVVPRRRNRSTSNDDATIVDRSLDVPRDKFETTIGRRTPRNRKT